MDPIAEQLVARLQGDPNDSAAYEALKAHYRHSGDLASLANLLEGWAGSHMHEVQSASEAYAEAADAVLQSTGERARTKRLYRHAVQLEPRHAEAGARLQNMLEEAGEYQELAEFLDEHVRALEAAGDQQAQLPALYQRLGQLWEQQFARSDVAVAYYERAAELGGGAAPQPPIDEAAARALAEEYQQAAEAESDPERKAGLLSQLADVRANQLSDLAGAIQVLRQALALLPGDVATMHQLATCLLARAASAEPGAARADQRRVAELFYQIAQAVDPGEAIPYLESALAAMPDHDGALAQLERLAPQQGRSDLLPQYWVGYVAHAGEGPERNLRRLALGQAYLQAGQFDDAIYCLKPAAESGNDRAHVLLQEAYGRQARAQARSDVPTGIPDAPASLLPTTRPAEQRRSSEEIARESAEIAALRRQVHDALAGRRHDEAAELCKQILEHEPSDPEAFTLLESHYRKRRDHASLRDLLLASTRVPGLAVDVRKLRLREVATLSEAKLRDADAAISAWRGVVTFDPSDREASSSLKRLLKKAQQWDELAAVLEREALATTGVDEKAALIREIALIHRDKRKDPAETAEAFRQLYALKPDDVAVRDELCELLLSLEYYADAVPLIRDQIETSKDEIDKVKLSALLASTLHEKCNEYDAAFEVCEQLLKLRPNDRATFDRMERIDEASQNYARLLQTLERRGQVAGKAERPALFIRMGEIAEQNLHDLDKAAEYFGDALDLVPDNQDALQRLSQMFERAGRYDQLVELLRERTLLEKEPKNRAPFYRRIAEILAERLEDQAGAADAYRSLLDLTEDEAALRFMRDYAQNTEDNEELSHALRRLAAIVTDASERRDLLFDQAVLLHERMARPNEAAVALKRIVDELDPQFEPAIELLVTVAEATGDRALLALAIERRLALLGTADERLPLARRLSDLCEHELKDEARAIAALQKWSSDDPQNAEPLRRLRELLGSAGRKTELLSVLDALAEWEQDFDARDEATIAAARTAQEQGDAQGAFGRLLPLVEQRNEVAERALRELALASGMQRQLAALYVKLAQETEDPAVQALYWRSAADLFERELNDPSQALEASLRMLATDLSNREFLAQVDRLAVATGNYKRLAQVYDRLIKQAEDEADRVALLKRHADLLEPDQPDEALDRVLRACALMPHDEPLLARAEDLAQRTRRSEELLVVYDRRRAKSEDDTSKLRLLLRAARLCDGALRDRDRANAYLKAALALAGESAELGAEVEVVAREFDAARPDAGADNARRALITSHREIAERADPAVAGRLWLRAAELLRSELDDDRAAFDVLRQGLSQLPRNEEIYAALTASAERLKRLDAVDAHVARLIDEAMDSNTAVALLKRRGELLEGPLNRWQDAAAVYTKLLQLRPDDAEIAEHLRANLRKSGRFQDLLLALNKQLQRTREPAKRLKLLKEMAVSWEQDLKNRWEAVDAWKAVLREADGDRDALAALQRLERSRTTSPEPLVDDGSEPPAARGDESVPEPSDDRPGAADDTPRDEASASDRDDDTPDGREAAPHGDMEPASAAPSTTAEHTDATDSDAVDAAASDGTAPARQATAGSGEGSAPPRQFVPEVDTSDEADLAALDARLSATSKPLEEVDVLEDLDSPAVDVDIEETRAIPTEPRRTSAPPPLPARGSRPGPPAHAQAPAAARTSSMPPPPPRASASGAPDAPGLPPRPSSVPPPLPGRRSAPPPLPSTPPRSNPPPLPSQRKQD